MGQLVVGTASTTCSMGMTPGTFMALPTNLVNASNKPAANIMDNKPMVNVMPFGMCRSPMNPQVIAATAAALGTLTPMPCIPVTVAPWAPGSATVMVGKFPALNNTSKCMCQWGGVISITAPGQFKANVP